MTVQIVSVSVVTDDDMGVPKLSLILIVNRGVKINGTYYHNVRLTQKLLPFIRAISGYSLSPNKKKHQHNPDAGQSLFWNGKYPH